jgi:hypothetical protein
MNPTLAISIAAMLGFCALWARSSIADAPIPATIEADCDLQDALALDRIDAHLQQRLRR